MSDEVVPHSERPLRYLRAIGHALVPKFFPFRKDAQKNPALAYLFLRHPPRITELSSIGGWLALLALQYTVLTNTPLNYFGYRYFIYAFTAYFTFASMVLTFDLAKDYMNRVLGTYPFTELRLTLLTPYQLAQGVIVAPLGLSLLVFTLGMLAQSALVMGTFINRIGYVPKDIVLLMTVGTGLMWLLGAMLSIYASLTTLRIHLLFKSKIVAQAKTLKRLPLMMVFALATIPLLSLSVVSYVPKLGFEIPVIGMGLYIFARMIYLLHTESLHVASLTLAEFDDWWCCREGEPKLDEELEALVPSKVRSIFFARPAEETSRP